MKCQWCDNKFSHKTSLNHHQKTAKYCLKIQGKKAYSIHECIGCSKSFSRLYEFNRHLNSCLSSNNQLQFSQFRNEIQLLKHDNEILLIQLIKRESDIKILQDKLENVAIKVGSRPTISNKTQINNYIQQLQPITDQQILDSVPNLTIDHVMRGAEGYAQYALDFPLKDKIVCVDYARRKIKYRGNDGKVMTDPEMTGISTKIFTSIKDRNKALIHDFGNKLEERFGDKMDLIAEMLDYKIAVDRGSDGEKTELHHDFVRKVCSKTIKE